MITKRNLITGLFISSMFLILSCDDLFDERIEGNNVVVTKIRSVTSFDEIVSTGNFDVYFTVADSTSLIIEAEENLFPFITTRVGGERIYIETKDNYRLDNNEPIKIILTSPNMEGVVLTGSGFIVCDSLSTDYFSAELTGSGKIEFLNIDVTETDAEISGSGDITLSGTVNRSELLITGSGNIKTLDLYQKYCEATITGSGNIYTNVEDHLKAVITGSGNIYYTGNPIIDKTITGTGSVKKH
jgi:hypothetical protein